MSELSKCGRVVLMLRYIQSIHTMIHSIKQLRDHMIFEPDCACRLEDQEGLETLYKALGHAVTNMFALPIDDERAADPDGLVNFGY